MKVALVYDRITKWGGAERVLLALHEIWPDAPLFTVVYNKQRAAWANVFRITPSFLQYAPFAKSHHELYPWATPMAFETFRFDGYDLVISVTSAEAKSIITKPETLHVCYCLTPTRYLWSGYDSYIKHPGMGAWSQFSGNALRALAPILRSWDLIAASRPDHYIAISETVSKRIKKYYGRAPHSVIYPPVDTKVFGAVPPGAKNHTTGDYFLTVSRLVGYKRVDLLIDAFNILGKRLIIIGDGNERYKLQKKAQKNITFVTHHLTDSELASYHHGCRAFVYGAEEDFGIAAVEALSCGKPVIAYQDSGVAETVKNGVCGILFAKQTVESLIWAVNEFEKKKFDSVQIRKHAEAFGKEQFQKRFKTTVLDLYKQHTI